MIGTGLSDFNKMIVAVMKMYFPKMKPRVIRYQKYKKFSNNPFVNTLRKELTKQEKGFGWERAWHILRNLFICSW